jgi:hypothetical protein
MHLRHPSLFLGLVTILPLVVAAACSSDGETSDDGSGGGAGEGASAGEGGSSGRGGSAGSAGNLTGGSSGTGGSGGTSGEGGAGGADDCADVEPLPATVDTDTTVGPGCVRIDRTFVTDGAVLTIEPGTTVLMAAGGFLDLGGNGDNSALVSIGTETDPITFTAEGANPAPGEWECVRVGGASSATEIRYTTFEYGGAPCSSTGADYEGALQINAAARAVSNSTFRQSLTHGVLIGADGGVREFENNGFSDNEEFSIDIAAPQLLVLGEGLEFADADDRIEVDTTFSLASTGTWLDQPVPFRVVGGLDIRGNAEVTLAAGVTLEMTGASIDVFTANLLVAGKETDPVTITSAQANPLPGDWGCIAFSSTTGNPRFEYAVIEYAGNGQGCTGANYETALRLQDSAVITNTTFRNIAGSAITASTCNSDDWCENTYESVEVGPLACGVGQMPTACP